MADHAGHDTNYLALSGVLGSLGRSDGAPLPPLNLLADMGGGGMLLAFGMVCGLLESRQSGRGQVIFAGSDACVTPVLTPEEAASHPRNVSRGSFQEVAGVRQAGPARPPDPGQRPAQPGSG